MVRIVSVYTSYKRDVLRISTRVLVIEILYIKPHQASNFSYKKTAKTSRSAAESKT